MNNTQQIRIMYETLFIYLKEFSIRILINISSACLSRNKSNMKITYLLSYL